MRRTPKSLSQTEQLSFIRLLSPHSHSHRTGWRQPFTKQIELCSFQITSKLQYITNYNQNNEVETAANLVVSSSFTNSLKHRKDKLQHMTDKDNAGCNQNREN